MVSLDAAVYVCACAACERHCLPSSYASPSKASVVHSSVVHHVRTLVDPAPRRLIPLHKIPQIRNGRLQRCNGRLESCYTLVDHQPPSQIIVNARKSGVGESLRFCQLGADVCFQDLWERRRVRKPHKHFLHIRTHLVRAQEPDDPNRPHGYKEAKIAAATHDFLVPILNTRWLPTSTVWLPTARPHTPTRVEHAPTPEEAAVCDCDDGHKHPYDDHVAQIRSIRARRPVLRREDGRPTVHQARPLVRHELIKERARGARVAHSVGAGKDCLQGLCE
mmetsp:Transcript_14198/g.34732  ORF Transcript_14198/g.34732 Transcript_14198/m.34732 type:complete len:277 (+) Transcript_14198:1322-2152(+)